MIKLDRANYLLSDIELLDGIAKEIHKNVGSQDWNARTRMIADFVAPVILWTHAQAIEYLSRRINFRDI
jgi:hypothetical protein